MDDVSSWEWPAPLGLEVWDAGLVPLPAPTSDGPGVQPAEPLSTPLSTVDSSSTAMGSSLSELQSHGV